MIINLNYNSFLSEGVGGVGPDGPDSNCLWSV